MMMHSRWQCNRSMTRLLTAAQSMEFSADVHLHVASLGCHDYPGEARSIIVDTVMPYEAIDLCNF